MKRYCKVVWAVALIVSLLVVPIHYVSAAEVDPYMPNTIYQVGSKWSWVEKSSYGNADFYLQLTGKEAHTGDMSLLVKLDDSHPYTRFESTLNASVPREQELHLTFYAKGTMSIANVKFGEDFDNLITGTSFTATPDTNGWTKYETSFTRSASGNLRFVFYAQPGTYLYIDDISLTLAGQTTNYYENASFENIWYPTAFDQYVESDVAWADGTANATNKFYDVTDLMSYSGDKSLYVRYTLGTNGYALNVLTGLFKANTNYDITMKVKGQIDNSGSSGYSNSGALICFNTGNGMFYIKGAKTGPDANGWYTVTHTLNNDGNSNAGFVQIRSYGGNIEGIFFDDIVVTEHSTGTVVASTDFDSAYIAQPQNEYPLLDWSVVDTTELAANNSFVEISDADKMSGNKSLYINYTPSASGQYIRIQNTTMKPVFLAGNSYEISFCAKGNYNPQNTVIYTNAWEAISAGNMTSTSMGNGWTRYTGTLNVTKNAGYFWLTLRSTTRAFIDDITVTNTTTGQICRMLNSDFEVDDLYVEDTVYKKNDTEINSMDTGTITASRRIKTYSGRNESVLYAVALYNSDESEMLDIAITSANVTADAAPTTLSLSITVPDGALSKLKSYIWRSGSLSPLANFGELN